MGASQVVLVTKNMPTNAGGTRDVGSIPGSGRSPREGNSNLLQLSCLENLKQEMAGVNINTLGISELKWTGMGEINSDDHYIYYCWQESLRRNRVALIINKRV